MIRIIRKLLALPFWLIAAPFMFLAIVIDGDC